MTGREASARMVEEISRGGGVSYSLTTVCDHCYSAVFFELQLFTSPATYFISIGLLLFGPLLVQTLCLQIPTINILSAGRALLEEQRTLDNHNSCSLQMSLRLRYKIFRNVSHIPSCWIASRRTSSSIRCFCN